MDEKQIQEAVKAGLKQETGTPDQKAGPVNYLVSDATDGYAFSQKDKNLLKEQGLLPPPLVTAFNNSKNWVITGEGQQIVANDIADRIKRGNTELPGDLMRLMQADVATKRLVQERMIGEVTSQSTLSQPTLTKSEGESRLPVWSPPLDTGYPRLHASAFDLGDGISKSNLERANRKGAYPADKLLEIIPVSTTRAYVRYADSAAAQKMALDDQYSHVNAAHVNKENHYTTREQCPHISTVKPGLLVLEGEKWRLAEKIDIRFDALSIDQSVAQTTLVQPPVETLVGVGTVSVSTGAQSGPETEPGITPIGWTVAATEKPDQVSDADFRGPYQTVEFRFDPVGHETPLTQASDSGVESLKIAEQVQAQELYLLLPAESEEIRQFLQNDGYLSNEEISRALYDARLEKSELREAVAGMDTSNNPVIADKITDYLWDVHKTVQDNPLLVELGPGQKYELVAITRRADPDRPTADEQTPKEAPHRRHEKQPGTVSKLLGLKTFDGGMLANALHNYAIMKELTQRLFMSSPEQTQTKQTPLDQVRPRYEWEQIAAQLEGKGITKQMLEVSGNLDPLLRGRRTETLQLEKNDNGVVTPVTGRLYIAETPDKGPVVYLSAKRQQLEMPNLYQGHRLTEADKKNLLTSGEMGRAVQLKDQQTGASYQALIGLDPENKRLTVMRQERFTPPIRIKGANITPQQQEVLRNHGTIRVKNLKDDKSDRLYTGDVQLSINKRGLVIKPVVEQKKTRKQGQFRQGQSRSEQKAIAADKKLNRVVGQTQSATDTQTRSQAKTATQTKEQTQGVPPGQRPADNVKKNIQAVAQQTNRQPGGSSASGKQKPADTSKTVSVQQKNGQQRVNVDESKGNTTTRASQTGPNQGQTAKIEQQSTGGAKASQTTLVNGQEKQQTAQTQKPTTGRKIKM